MARSCAHQTRAKFFASFPKYYVWFVGRDPFNQNSNRSDREKRTTSKGGPVFSKLFRLDQTDPLSFGPKFPESLVEWIAPVIRVGQGQCVRSVWWQRPGTQTSSGRSDPSSARRGKKQEQKKRRQIKIN